MGRNLHAVLQDAIPNVGALADRGPGPDDTLTPSRSVAFTTDERPTLQDLPRTTSGPSRPSTKDPAPTYTGGRRLPAVTSASGAIFARPAARRRCCAFR